MRIKKTTLYDFLGVIIVSSIALIILVGMDMVEERNWSLGSGESVSICSDASPAGNAGKAPVSTPLVEVNEEGLVAQVNEDNPDEQVSGECSIWNAAGDELYTGF